ncbi:hypothetical protein JYA63_15120 [Fictibacillus nanhaiensis]|uniref:Bacitracin ABC transporter ATP-binding protein n=1 Tax=Fictibacillus nanhaiensis TaxID=742169 RepID=A0ABS2ZTW3_9BACL|nr:hypothetical protein [Fictibacillus nanhaiensis]
MSKQKKPLFSDEYLTSLAQEINEQFGDYGEVGERDEEYENMKKAGE